MFEQTESKPFVKILSFVLLIGFFILLILALNEPNIQAENEFFPDMEEVNNGNRQYLFVKSIPQVVGNLHTVSYDGEVYVIITQGREIKGIVKK